MGRPRTVNTALPRYCSAFKDRHGKTRVRFRRTGWATRYAQHEPGTPEFTQEFHEWQASGKIKTGADRIEPGSWDDLITRFYASPDFKKKAAETQRSYRGELERFRATYGGRKVATMTARHIDQLMTLSLIHI